MGQGEKLRIVLDTNVILNALSRKLPYQHILRSLLTGSYQLFVTTEILLEYEEKITEYYGQPTALPLLDALAASSHVQKTETYFRFNILSDLDDNKFLDGAFASNAHFIVSDDKGFRALKNLDFPKIEVITLEEFSAMLSQLSLAGLITPPYQR